MPILVFNSGSSSLKFRLFDEGRSGNIEQFVKGMVTELGPHARCEWWAGETVQRFVLPLADQREAAGWALGRVEDILAKRFPAAQLTAVGHRVAHDGGLLASPVRISDAVLAQIEATAPLAPQHNPVAAEVIRTSRAQLGSGVPMVAVFDTAFFRDLPDVAGRYALPAEWTKKYGVRRYGFHGIAHRYMSGRYAQISQAAVDTSRVITVQLGHTTLVQTCRRRSADTALVVGEHRDQGPNLQRRQIRGCADWARDRQYHTAEDAARVPGPWRAGVAPGTRGGRDQRPVPQVRSPWHRYSQTL
jgi:acetate kinase